MVTVDAPFDPDDPVCLGCLLVLVALITIPVALTLRGCCPEHRAKTSPAICESCGQPLPKQEEVRHAHDVQR